VGTCQVSKEKKKLKIIFFACALYMPVNSLIQAREFSKELPFHSSSLRGSYYYFRNSLALRH
jgi:hypothetical protein